MHLAIGAMCDRIQWVETCLHYELIGLESEVLHVKKLNLKLEQRGGSLGSASGCGWDVVGP